MGVGMSYPYGLATGCGNNFGNGYGQGFGTGMYAPYSTVQGDNAFQTSLNNRGFENFGMQTPQSNLPNGFQMFESPAYDGKYGQLDYHPTASGSQSSMSSNFQCGRNNAMGSMEIPGADFGQHQLMPNNPWGMVGVGGNSNTVTYSGATGDGVSLGVEFPSTNFHELSGNNIPTLYNGNNAFGLLGKLSTDLEALSFTATWNEY